MTAAARLLERLENVKQTGPGRWIAQCPVHDDRNPSLSIRETGDRVLLHCWSGCSAAHITAAVGLRLGDLFERPASSIGPLPKHQRFDWRGAWRCLHHEALIAALAAADAASTLNAGAPDAR